MQGLLRNAGKKKVLIQEKVLSFGKLNKRGQSNTFIAPFQKYTFHPQQVLETEPTAFVIATYLATALPFERSH